ncbi:hypothetical protein D3C87_2033490 [compost metagenome]
MISDLQGSHALANCFYYTTTFVPQHAGENTLRIASRKCESICMADASGDNTNSYFPSLRWGYIDGD